jgi:aerobic-type carbon monoxide dehydrogenase small subunit (CoxS/CutS family)
MCTVTIGTCRACTVLVQVDLCTSTATSISKIEKTESVTLKLGIEMRHDELYVMIATNHVQRTVFE